MIVYWVMAGIYCITAMWFQKVLKELSMFSAPDRHAKVTSVSIFIVSLFWILFVIHDLLFGNKGG